MPWMALAPDISGVCSVEETFEITSVPTNTLRTKIVSQTTASSLGVIRSLVGSSSLEGGRGWARAGSRRRG